MARRSCAMNKKPHRPIDQIDPPGVFQGNRFGRRKIDLVGRTEENIAGSL
jgi:hypothetical protein